MNNIIDRVTYLCRFGTFTSTSEPTLEQVQDQITYEYSKLGAELERKGLNINDYSYEAIEIVSYKVAGEILIGNSRNNESLNALGKEYLGLYKENKKELLGNVPMIGSKYTEKNITADEYPNWIDEEIGW